jgi:hypothetical protein
MRDAGGDRIKPDCLIGNLVVAETRIPFDHAAMNLEGFRCRQANFGR